MADAGDNFDLQMRRKRLRLTQRDMMLALGAARVADISNFEQGYRRDLPGGKTREDYVRVLDDVERRGWRVV